MPGTPEGWRGRHRRLTKKDIETLAPLFGFWNPKDFARFIEIQDQKACQKNPFDQDEHITNVVEEAKRTA